MQVSVLLVYEFNAVLWNNFLIFNFSFPSDYLSSELQAMRMIGGDEDKMEIDEEVSGIMGIFSYNNFWIIKWTLLSNWFLKLQSCTW